MSNGEADGTNLDREILQGRSMKVLTVAEQLRRAVPGGVGTYVRGLARGLRSQASVEVGVWASRAPRGGDVVREVFAGSTVKTVPLPSRVLTRLWDRGLVEPPQGWDIVHATSFALPPNGTAPMTAMVHDLAWRSFPDAYPERGRRWHEAALHRTIERCAALLTPSQATATALIDLGVDPSSVTVAPLGCDHLADPDDASVERRLLGHGVHGPFLLAVGTLEPRKNLDRLMAAYARVAAELPGGMPLVVVGPTGWGEAVTPVPGVVMFGTATSSELTALYRRCEVFVSVPLLEGFGLPVVEAMSQGAPVVASAMPSAGGAAYLVDPMNVSGIAEAIAHVANDEGVRRDLSARGRAHASTLTWERCARLHTVVWDRLA